MASRTGSQWRSNQPRVVRTGSLRTQSARHRVDHGTICGRSCANSGHCKPLCACVDRTKFVAPASVGGPEFFCGSRPTKELHRRDRRVQAPQSPCWLSPHRTGDCACLWHRYRQRHRPPRAREALSTWSRKRWPVLAELDRAYEGQPVERRFVSLQIDTLAQPLGHGSDGRVHTSDHWLRR